MKLEGSMSLDARERTIAAFTNDPDVKVRAACCELRVLHPVPQDCSSCK